MSMIPEASCTFDRDTVTCSPLVVVLAIGVPVAISVIIARGLQECRRAAPVQVVHVPREETKPNYRVEVLKGAASGLGGLAVTGAAKLALAYFGGPPAFAGATMYGATALAATAIRAGMR